MGKKAFDCNCSRGGDADTCECRAALSASEQRVGELLKAINDHNHECQRICGFGDQEAVMCGYRSYFENTRRRCSTCPTHNMVDIPVAAIHQSTQGAK